MKLANIANVRRLAVASVAANLAVPLLAAVALPAELIGVLPVVALTLPLLTISLVERVAECSLGGAV